MSISALETEKVPNDSREEEHYESEITPAPTFGVRGFSGANDPFEKGFFSPAFPQIPCVDAQLMSDDMEYTRAFSEKSFP